MFLLFQIEAKSRKTDPFNLHSNMFLLFLFPDDSIGTKNFIYIPICFYYFFTLTAAGYVTMKFTFQYVSIISKLPKYLPYLILDLHSNMFLLFHTPTPQADNSDD